MVVRHKVKREVELRVYGPHGRDEHMSFPTVAAMDRWLDAEFCSYLPGTVAYCGPERYEVLPETEDCLEPWQRRAALVRKAGLVCLLGGAAWLTIGLCLATHGGLHILGRAGLSLAYLGGVLYGATWLAGHAGLSTANLERRLANWAGRVTQRLGRQGSEARR